MRASELIACFERMLAGRWAYEWGAAREGCVDCSGAFVWAFGRFGQSIDHGSNTIARKHIAGALRPASEAKPGWAVFKWREPSDGMPDKYRNDGLGDIYHVGLLAADGRSVLNAKGEKFGFSSDPLDKWDYAAPLKGVDYEEGISVATDNPLYTAKVVLSSGYLNVRSAASKNATSVGKLYSGDTVSVYEDIALTTNPAQNWSCIGDNKWVSSDYLVRVSDAASGSSGAIGESGTVVIPYALAKQLYLALGNALSID